MAEDRLAKRRRTRELGLDVGFEVVDDGELVFYDLDDRGLFGERGERNAIFSKIFEVNVREA
jgi:hypothetical protein